MLRVFRRTIVNTTHEENAVSRMLQYHNPTSVADALAHFRSSTTQPTTKHCNLTLASLCTSHGTGPALPLLQIYDYMRNRSMAINAETYNILLLALTERDHQLESNGDLTTERKENFASLLALYYESSRYLLSQQVYVNLLRTCYSPFHSNINAVSHIFDHAQECSTPLWPDIYQYLIQSFGTTKDITTAEDIFQRYVSACQQKLIQVQNPKEGIQKPHSLVYHSMLEAYFQSNQPDKAMQLLDRMADSKATGPVASFAETPLPCASTCSIIIQGYLDIGDVKSALFWFDRLFAHGITVYDQFLPSKKPIKPDIAVVGKPLLQALYDVNLISDLNRIFLIVQALPDLIFKANSALLPIQSPSESKKTLDLLAKRVLPISSQKGKQTMSSFLVHNYLTRGLLTEALYTFVDDFRDRLLNVTPDLRDSIASSFHEFCSLYLETTMSRYTTFPFNEGLLLMASGQSINVEIDPKWHQAMLHSYGLAKRFNNLDVEVITPKDWEQLLSMAAQSRSSPNSSLEIPNYAFAGIESLGQDIIHFDVDVSSFPSSLLQFLPRKPPPTPPAEPSISEGSTRKPLDWPRNLHPRSASIPTSPSEHSGTFAINTPLSIRIEAILQKPDHSTHSPSSPSRSPTPSATPNPRHGGNSLNAAYTLLHASLKYRQLPSPTVLAKLIELSGRSSDMEKVRMLYALAQEAFRTVMLDFPRYLRRLWVGIEDAMVIALAFSGDLEGAQDHRARIRREGECLSLKAYGALILNICGTAGAGGGGVEDGGGEDGEGCAGGLNEEDVRNVKELFDEAIYGAQLKLGATLYNHFLHKLSISPSSRPHFHSVAWQFFETMKRENVKPNLQTFFPLFRICADTGDAEKAERVFKEMDEKWGLKRSVKVFNELLRCYTETDEGKDRERALGVVERMKRDGVKFTPHTYKYLLDAYGTIQPISTTGLQTTLAELSESTVVRIQGMHYASLITSYGTQANLSKALEIFNSVPLPTPTSPALVSSQLDLIIAFNALLPILTAQKTPQPRLIMEAFEKVTKVLEVCGGGGVTGSGSGVKGMRVDGVNKMVGTVERMVNRVMWAFAKMGEVREARNVFERLGDGFSGGAGEAEGGVPVVFVKNGVEESQKGVPKKINRRLSNWERIVKIELEAGNRDEALELVRRFESRKYPEAVVRRIKSLVDSEAD